MAKFGIPGILILISIAGCGGSAKKTDSPGGLAANVSEELATETGSKAKPSKKSNGSETAEILTPKGISDHVPDETIREEKYRQLGKAIQIRSETMVLDIVAKNLSIDQNDLKTLNGLAVFYLETDRPLLARIALRRAIENDKANPALFNNLGLSYVAENDLIRASEHFRRSLDLDPENSVASANLGALALKFGNFKRAHGLLQMAYRAMPKNEAIAFSFARACTEVGEFQIADGIFEKLLETKGREPLVNLGYAANMIQLKKDSLKIRQTLNKIKILTSDPDILKAADTLMKKLGT